MEEETKVVSEAPVTKVVEETDHKDDKIKVLMSCCICYFGSCLLYFESKVLPKDSFRHYLQCYLIDQYGFY